MPYADRLRKALVGRTGDWLARKSWPQSTMLLSFAAAGIASYGCGLLLDAWHVPWVGLRLLLNSAAAYLGYALFLMAWIRCQPATEAMALLHGAPAEIETRDPWDPPEDDAWSGWAQAFERQLDTSAREVDDGSGLVGFLLLVSVMGVLFVALHAIWYARWILGSLLVDGGRIRHRALGHVDPWAWASAPWRQSYVIALALAANHATVAVVVQCLFPQANSVADVLRMAG